MKRQKVLLLSAAALLGIGTVATIAVNNSGIFQSNSMVARATDTEVSLSLTSANKVTSDGEKSYNGVSEGAIGSLKITYSGVESAEDVHVALAQNGAIEMPINRAVAINIKATGSFVLEYGENKNTKGGRESFTGTGSSLLVNFPAEVNFVKITASSALSVESLELKYMTSGNCTQKADNTYGSGLLNVSDIYYGNEKVTFNTKEYSHKIKLSDASRLELVLSRDAEDDVTRFFMFTSQEGNSVTFEDSQGNSVVLTGEGLLEKTAVISLDGQSLNGSYAKLQKLNSFNLDDFGSYTIAVGETYTIHAVNFTPSNATFKDVVWESSDESVASVSGSGENYATANVTILAAGSTTISAHVVSDPDEGTIVTATRTVTFNATSEIALPSTFYGNNWVSDFENTPDYTLDIDDSAIILEDNVNDNSGVVLHVAYQSGSTYYLTDDFGLYVFGASYSNGQITIAANYTANGNVHPGTGTIVFSKPEVISSVKATIGGVEYKTAESAYQMIAGNQSGYVTFTRTGGNNFQELDTEVVITDDPLAGVPEETPEPATLPGTWTGEGYTVVVSNDEQTLTISGGDFDELECTYDDGYGYFMDENWDYLFSFGTIEGGNVTLEEINYSLEINLSKDGYVAPEPRKDVFTFNNGFITANREGKGYIKHSWRDYADGSTIKSAYLYVEISERVTVASVALSTNPNGAEVAINGEITINAAITPSVDGKAINASNITWTKTEKVNGTQGQGSRVSSNNTSYVFKGTAAGEVTITWNDSVSGLSESITITITSDEADVVPAGMQGTWVGYEDYYSLEVTLVINKNGTLTANDEYGFCVDRDFSLTNVSGDTYTFEDNYDNVLTIVFDGSTISVTGDIDGYLGFAAVEFALQ